MYLGMGLWFHPTWSLSSCLFICMYFIKVGKMSVLISSNISLLFFLSLSSQNSHTICVDPFDCVPQVLLTLFTLLQYFFFLFLRITHSNFSCLRVPWFFILPAHISLWISLENFSFQLLYVWAPEFLVDCFFSFSISLLISPFCSYIIFLTFPKSFVSSSRIFRVVLKSV